MRGARMLRSSLGPASHLVGACMFGVLLLLSACAAQQAGISTADATLTAVATPMTRVSPTPTPNATAMAATSLGCSSTSSLYFETPPGPLPTTIPLPPGTLVQNQSLGISGPSAMYYFCTPGATHAVMTAYIDSALPAAGWTSTTPQGCIIRPPGQWFKGHYGIRIDFTDSSLPEWAMEITKYTSGC